MQPQPQTYRSHAAQPARKGPPRWVFGLLGMSVVVALVVIVAAIALGGGDSGDDGQPAGTASDAAKVAAEQAYLAALVKIDPALADSKSAVNDGRNTCLDIEQGKDAATVTRNAAARAQVDTATAARIVAAARANLCP